MAKILLLLAVVAIVYALLRNYKRVIARQQESDRTGDPAPVSSEDMVQCARCGIHLPRSEGFLEQGRFFCTDDHRRLGPK